MLELIDVVDGECVCVYDVMWLFGVVCKVNGVFVLEWLVVMV